MSRSGKISVALPRQQITQLKDIVDAGEYGSAAAVIREALRSFLHRRDVRAGGLARFTRSRQGRLGTGLCMHTPVSPVSPGSKQSPGQAPKQWRQWPTLGI